ncbi:hypothetical protein BGX38DRAFT_1272660 [Terfezia claveryi]|nr:hypothetical protein BGX38DRAFT_1272660 [Terfezia claveryi]
MVDRMPVGPGGKNIGSVLPRRPRSDGLKMEKDNKNVLKEITAELKRLRLMVKDLETLLETERREKDIWRNKYEELEKASKGKERPQALFSGCSNVPRHTPVGPDVKECDTVDHTLSITDSRSTRSSGWLTMTPSPGPHVSNEYFKKMADFGSGLRSSSPTQSTLSIISSTTTSATIDCAPPAPAPKVIRSTYAPPVATPTPAALQRVGAVNPSPCLEYYLGPQGCPPGTNPCKFPHHHRFTPEELLALRYIAQKTRCSNGLNCVNKLCYFGHQCIALVLGVRRCQGGSSCGFKKEEHLPEQLAGTNVAVNDAVPTGLCLKNPLASTGESSSGKGVTLVVHNGRVAPTGPKHGLQVPIVAAQSSPPSSPSVTVVPTAQAVDTSPPPVQIDDKEVTVLVTAPTSQPEIQRVKRGQGSPATWQRRERRARAEAREEERKRNAFLEVGAIWKHTGRCTAKKNVEEPMKKFAIAIALSKDLKIEATKGEQAAIAPKLEAKQEPQAYSSGSEKKSSTENTDRPEADEDLLVWDGEADTTAGSFDEEWDAPLPESLYLAPFVPVASVAPVNSNDEINLLEF